MSIKNVLFDLDGTLLPMDQDTFIKAYFGLLARKLAPLGYDPDRLIQGIWTGTMAMVKNDGTAANETVFWNTFAQLLGEHTRADEPVFEEYYHNEFQQVQQTCGFAPKAAEVIHRLQEKGKRLVLATNPIFPAVATRSRVRWAGLNWEDFELVTTYENSSFCKPNPTYYLQILNKLGMEPEECLMVGNDVTEDMVAETLGMKTFLLTDCIINKDGRDISAWPHGGFEELLAYIETL